MFVKRFKNVLEYIVATSLKLMGDVLMGLQEIKGRLEELMDYFIGFKTVEDGYGQYGVVDDILGAVQGASGVDESQVALAVGLDGDIVAKYLDSMVRKGLLSSEDSKYMITDKGGEYRDTFSDLKSAISLDE